MVSTVAQGLHGDGAQCDYFSWGPKSLVVSLIGNDSDSKIGSDIEGSKNKVILLLIIDMR